MFVPISDQVTSLPRACGGEISATATVMLSRVSETGSATHRVHLTVDRVDREAEAAAEPD